MCFLCRHIHIGDFLLCFLKTLMFFERTTVCSKSCVYNLVFSPTYIIMRRHTLDIFIKSSFENWKGWWISVINRKIVPVFNWWWQKWMRIKLCVTKYICSVVCIVTVVLYKMFNNLSPHYLSSIVPNTVGESSDYNLRNEGHKWRSNFKQSNIRQYVMPAL
jgi:hypothetical protein